MIFRKILLIFTFAALSSVFYVGYSASLGRIGFPLDDAWIHQTYARNVSQGYGWSFEAGKLSGGATAPLWTLLISFGYWLKIPPLFWAFMLGVVFLASTSVLVVRCFEEIDPKISWLGLYFLIEWHFSWASVSGMETILAVFLVIFVFYLLKMYPNRYLLSLCLAASVWVRPDLVTLFLPVLVWLLSRRAGFGFWQPKIFVIFLLPALSIIAYLIFNQWVSGAFFPTTFYAKQAEYAEMRKFPFLYRFWQQFSIALIGSGVLLLGGFFYQIYHRWIAKDWEALSWVAWYLIIVGVYAARLPVTYQHGRYMIPAIVVYYLFGLQGSVILYRWLVKKRRWGWILARSGLLSWLVTSLAFWWFGGSAYGRDVMLIETQMVDIAKWAEKNLPSNSRLAVHDIGAIGYFTTHELIDLAGLINPEVIPFIRDENKLAEYLDRKDVDYLICFPEWYPRLTKGLQIVHQADSRVVREYDELPMTIFRWNLNSFISLKEEGYFDAILYVQGF